MLFYEVCDFDGNLIGGLGFWDVHEDEELEDEDLSAVTAILSSYSQEGFSDKEVLEYAGEEINDNGWLGEVEVFQGSWPYVEAERMGFYTNDAPYIQLFC